MGRASRSRMTRTSGSFIGPTEARRSGSTSVIGPSRRICDISGRVGDVDDAAESARDLNIEGVWGRGCLNWASGSAGGGVALGRFKPIYPNNLEAADDGADTPCGDTASCVAALDDDDDEILRGPL
jgi:hypothetical protein